ncbi:MAG: hypothetical protein U9Q98_10730 [Bacteroidota bacterium]|nr:hypothetical protein [Bacteroidota bacterium]
MRSIPSIAGQACNIKYIYFNFDILEQSVLQAINLSLNYQGWLDETTTPENNILLSMEYKF